jgi:uncharacterized membrane protein YeaQ/YmgE (transglycosylase-associated protein family)
MLIADIDITFGNIIGWIVAGLVIGAIARLIVPGRQPIGILGTILIGMVAAVVGGILWQAIFSGNEGIAWIGSIIVAILLIVVYERVVAGRSTAT